MGKRRLPAATSTRTAVFIVAAVVFLAAGMASGAGTAVPWKFHQLDNDRCWDAATKDANLNGYSEEVWYDVDNDCRWDTHLWNSVGADNLLESLTFDMDEDRHWEYWLVDTNQRIGFDVAFFDDNEDGYYDRWARLGTAPDPSLGTIGGPQQRTGTLLLLDWLADKTGRAVWAGPDSDSDGYPDLIDRHPTDRRYR